MEAATVQPLSSPPCQLPLWRTRRRDVAITRESQFCFRLVGSLRPGTSTWRRKTTQPVPSRYTKSSMCQDPPTGMVVPAGSRCSSKSFSGRRDGRPQVGRPLYRDVRYSRTTALGHLTWDTLALDAMSSFSRSFHRRNVDDEDDSPPGAVTSLLETKNSGRLVSIICRPPSREGGEGR